MGKVAIVTGAGSGIGRLVALGLIRHDYDVVLAGRAGDRLMHTCLEGARSEHTLVVPTDVTDPLAVRHLFETVETHFNRVDLLFNNAGAFSGGSPVDEVSPEDWRKIIDVNLNGAFYCAQAAFKAMKKQRPSGGRIINNGSISAQVPRPNAVAYNTSKHAITGLTKTIALEGRPFGIACGQIDIGNAATSMTASMATGMLQADGTMRPEPTMDAANVVEAILFMAGLPLDANVPFLTVAATKMPFIGRG
ncbi:SDR family NAD(P)-dependent oxidoreductase [Bradyrhizobium sp. Arg237L]|uniref:SDR family oxidoreductase n=1 Tax=Bradyrhizobium sp. Arg237L TaxID=3003352 RepID=UPI00249E5873|nr:SDR family oxidoreductase [Bradyrhizobium sp. Arg237L]MDI4234182.1 SDR family NAD(P)-dependent oxidoreductase [Bradyrhizobium sp. Arg237L]